MKKAPGPSGPMEQAMRLPEIYLSSEDFERLEALADSLSGAGQNDIKAAFFEELARACVLAPDDIPADTVTMNSIVRFRVDGREFCKTLVYPRDASDSDNRVSINSPVGMALVGLQQGAVMQWPRPGGGSLQVEIVEVLYQPQACGAARR